MALPAIVTQHTDEATHRRRISETVNGILRFQNDDSRVQTPAESLAGVTPVNYAYATEPSYNIKRFGAANSNTDAQNLAALNQAILAGQNAPGAASQGGFSIVIPADCHYGYVRTTRSTWPQLSGTVPITVYDYSLGASYGTYPANYDGNQVRIFSYTPQPTVIGGTDGNNWMWRSVWAPNVCIFNDADLSGARTANDNRRARYLIGNEGNFTWGIGQGNSGSSTQTSEQLSDFLIQLFHIAGETLPADINCLRIERKTGNWLFNAGASLPAASYHFVSTVTGFAQAIFESVATDATSSLYLRQHNNSAQDVALINRAGQLCLNISAQGDAATFDLANRRATFVSTQVARTVVAYSANMNINNDLGNVFFIAATNGTAFSIGNPNGTNPGAAQRITITVQNTSGGALGVATFGGKYKMAAWTQPANGFNRTIDFLYDTVSQNWYEVSRTAADIPN